MADQIRNMLAGGTHLHCYSSMLPHKELQFSYNKAVFRHKRLSAEYNILSSSKYAKIAIHSLTVTMSPEAHHIDTSRFWVVLIGIDGYPMNLLRGCVNDALLMEAFLVEDLGVPKSRIQILLGSKTQGAHGDPTLPTRANIIQTHTSLIYNSEIEHGDNIVIYFSGHGSSYFCEEYCRKGAGPVEALCPMDRTEEDGFPVPDINDPPGLSGKNIPPMSRKSLTCMLDAADDTAKNFPECQSVFAAEWRPDMTSHVILAACREREIAKEERVETGLHGVFTESLVRTLKSGASNERSTQESAVAGRYKHAMLWYRNA
ncbi:hypothetical protein IW262DRAFT_1299243 [Armillaria fumosa]|nr:hypothetical protein IW262DRAFT_1299243 [Armillaria fumosa]